MSQNETFALLQQVISAAVEAAVAPLREEIAQLKAPQQGGSALEALLNGLQAGNAPAKTRGLKGTPKSAKPAAKPGSIRINSFKLSASASAAGIAVPSQARQFVKGIPSSFATTHKVKWSYNGKDTIIVSFPKNIHDGKVVHLTV